MENKVTELAYAKVNLGLNILGKRDDGYHGVDMVMQTVGLADTIVLTKANAYSLTCNGLSSVEMEDNLATRAAQYLSKCTGRELKVHIELDKKIFVAAGLGGGSADAAAVLRGLNRLWRLGLSLHQLEGMGAEIGSDVPFCVSGGTARATDRGQLLTYLPDMPPCYVVIAKPRHIEVSTYWAYKTYDGIKRPFHPDIEGLVQGIEQQDLEQICCHMGNGFERMLQNKYNILTTLKKTALALGAHSSLMSGSGPSVFALTQDKVIARKIMQEWKAIGSIQVAAVKTISREKAAQIDA